MCKCDIFSKVTFCILKYPQYFTRKFMDINTWAVSKCSTFYSLMDMRQLHILFNSAKTWHVLGCWFLCFPLNLPELNLKLFWTSDQNNLRFSSGKFRGKQRNQQTITCQISAELNKIWFCLIFINRSSRRKRGMGGGFICTSPSWLSLTSSIL